MAASQGNRAAMTEHPTGLIDAMETLRRTRSPDQRTELLRSTSLGLKTMKDDLVVDYMSTTQLSPLFQLCIEHAMQPDFSQREHFIFEKDDFIDFVERVEAVLSFLCTYFDICVKNPATQTTCIDDCLPRLLVLVSSHIRSSLWSTDAVQTLSVLVLNQLRMLYKADSLPELLLLDVKCRERDATTPSTSLLGRYLAVIKQILTKDQWQRNPTVAESFYWMLTNMMKFPHLSDHLDTVLPPALMFTDSHVTEHRIMGILCLHHIAANVSGEELRWYGRADVVFTALKQQIYSREPEIIQVLHPALLTVLPIVDKDPSKPPSPLAPKHVDDILSIIITNAQTENGLVLRRLYTQCIADFVDILGICAVRHLGNLLELVSSYLEVFDGPEEQARFNTLKLLKSVIRNTWPRLRPRTEGILKTLLKLIQDIATDKSLTPDSVKEQLTLKAVECLSLLKQLSPKVGDCLQKICENEELSYMTSALKLVK